jgi:hypothetical protein
MCSYQRLSSVKKKKINDDHENDLNSLILAEKIMKGKFNDSVSGKQFFIQ